MKKQSGRNRQPKRIAVSTIRFRPDEVEGLKELQPIFEEAGYLFSVQPHHTNDQPVLDAIKESGLPVHSVHGPLLSDHVINLTADDEASQAALEQTVGVMEDLGAEILIFHGFFLADHAIRTGPDFYARLAAELEERLGAPGKKDRELAFFNTRAFHLMKERVKVNFRQMRLDHEDLSLCLKNDFPALGTGARSPDQIAFLEAPFWIDTAHLWAAALRDGFDFYRGLSALLETRRIEGICLHTNQMPLNQTLGLMRGHGHLYARTDMSLPKVFSLCRRHNIRNFCLEIEDIGPRDAEYFLEATTIPTSDRLPRMHPG